MINGVVEIKSFVYFCANLKCHFKSAQKQVIYLNHARLHLYSYIIFPLRPYFANISKRLSKMPKIYFYDSIVIYDGESYPPLAENIRNI